MERESREKKNVEVLNFGGERKKKKRCGTTSRGKSFFFKAGEGQRGEKHVSPFKKKKKEIVMGHFARKKKVQRKKKGFTTLPEHPKRGSEEGEGPLLQEKKRIFKSK